VQIFLAVLSSLGVIVAAAILIEPLARRLLFVRQLRAPLYLAALAGAIKVYTLFQVTQNEMLGRALFWALMFLPIMLLVRLFALYFFDLHLKVHRAVVLPPMIASVAVWTAYVIAGIITLKVAFGEDLKLTAIAATSAVTSLVLGLALQPILANFFAGLVITAERPFRINDWVKIGDREGRVVGITWRTTQLRTRDNDNLIIPNGKIADAELINFYQPHKLHMERINVGLHYSTPPYRARRVLIDALAGLDGVLDNPTPDVFVLSFDDSAVSYEVRVWIEDYANRPRIVSDVRARIWEGCRKAGISIPYPIRTLELAPRPSRAAGREPKARLFVTEGDDRGLHFRLGASPVTVGRSRTCDLALTDPQASKEHLRIELAGGSWQLTDLGSSFGTKVNGQPVTQVELRDLDRIAVGNSVIVFERDDN
jgi:small-conductance mechanosensitive channel